MANGAGKVRSRTDGSARKTAKFRVMFLSSGEIGLADKVAEDNRSKRPTAGQQIRIVDVPADAGAGYGLFENLHGHSSGKALSKYIVEAAKRVYGTAGRAFLAAIVPELDDVKRRAGQAMVDFCELCLPPGADGQVARVAQRFALIAFAGELAIEKGILPWEAGEAVKAAETCFKAWLAERGHTGAAEVYGGIEAVRSFLQTHGMSRFIPAWEEEKEEKARSEAAASAKPGSTAIPLRPPTPLRDVAGYRKKSEGGWEFYINDVGWTEMCAGFNPKLVAKALLDADALLIDPAAIGATARLKKYVRIPDHGKTRYYHVAASFLQDKEDLA
jgi:putative DNA primase/helicase